MTKQNPSTTDQSARQPPPRNPGDLRRSNRDDRGRSPEIDDDVTGKELDREAARQLSTLNSANRTWVAKHLVMAGRLIDIDPDLALEHALAASRRGGRLALVREAVGLAAYAVGDYAEALRELRTYRRISGDHIHMGVMADCLRGLGRPTKAIELAAEPESQKLSGSPRAELAMVISGAHHDQGDYSAAAEALEIPELNINRAYPFSPRLFTAYAAALEQLGRSEEAQRWNTQVRVAQQALGTGAFADPEILDFDEDEPDTIPPKAHHVVEGTGSQSTPDQSPDRTALIDHHDAVLFDLDGVLYAGTEAMPGAPDALIELRSRSVPCAFVTNNASRSAEQIAAHLRDLGIFAQAHEVISSAPAGVAMLRQEIPPPATVLVIGSSALRELVSQAGYSLGQSAQDQPDAVIQGFDPTLAWADLAEAAYAINQGARWFATNLDRSVPRERGLAPANGALVEAISFATGTYPTAAGKPEPLMFTQAAASLNAKAPLVIGDRLDTDVLGGNRAGFTTALVLTGASTESEARQASGHMRPDLIIDTLGDLFSHNHRSLT